MSKKKKTNEKKTQATEERKHALYASIHHINQILNAETPKRDWKQYVHLAEDRTSPFLLRRPTGIASLDIALGGGFPAGGPVQIAAPDGVGKNALCLQLIANCQRIYGDDAAIAWCCTEITFDKPFAHLNGVAVPLSDSEIAMENTSRRTFHLPELNKEEIAQRKRSTGTFVIVDYGSTAKRLEAVVELVRRNQFQIIVIDSVAAILTDKRDDTPLDEFSQQSSEAFLLTEFQKKLWGAYAPADDGTPNFTTLIEINQARAKRNLKGPFDRKWQVGGAYALKHAKLGDILLTRGEPLQSTLNEDTDADPLAYAPRKRKITIGKKVKWEISKGKAGFHEGPRGVVEYHFDSGFDAAKDLIDTAADYGVVTRTKPSTYALINEHGEVVEEVRGKSRLYDLAQDRDWFDTVYTMVMCKAGVTCLCRL